MKKQPLELAWSSEASSKVTFCGSISMSARARLASVCLGCLFDEYANASVRDVVSASVGLLLSTQASQTGRLTSHGFSAIHTDPEPSNHMEPSDNYNSGSVVRTYILLPPFLPSMSPSPPARWRESVLYWGLASAAALGAADAGLAPEII